ncbi:ADP-ribosylglycohydrolase family protein [Alphaproteobacteria bacterium]|nr:ADP-ribosylglycohydrolase family protein [Alphaproteobacteria bacterium]
MYNDIILEGIKAGDQNGGPSELSKILNSSLIACNGFNKKDLTARYLNWWKSDAFDTGPTFAGVFTHINNGIEPDEAVKKVHLSLNGNTAGCGPAHRVLPLAGFLDISEDKLIEITKKEAKITHYHPDAGNGSAILVMLCRYLIEGQTIKEAKKSLTNNTYLNKSWEKVLTAKISPDGYIFNVIKSALYFLDKKDALRNSIKFAGPANYSPVIVGVITKIN